MRTILTVLLLSVWALAAPAALAATEPAPVDGTSGSGTIPWALLAIPAAVVAVVAMARWPRLRRPMAAIACFAAGALAAFWVLLAGAISTMDTGGGVPGPAVAGAIVSLVVGSALAVLIARRGAPTANE